MHSMFSKHNKMKLGINNGKFGRFINMWKLTYE